MAREFSTEHARAVLGSEGFTVEDIHEAPPEERADLRAWFDSEEYLVEAKLRGPHAGWEDLLREARAKGSAMATRAVQPWSALASMVREAYSQLVATPAGPNAFRILWAIAFNDDDKFVAECLQKRLLGEVLVLPVDRSALTIGESRTCYHHASNSFEQCPKLDAAVGGTKRDAVLIVNYFSERRQELRSSRLHQMFARHKAVIDPELEEAAGSVFMLGRDFVGPRDGTKQWAYLRDRYGVATSVMQESQFSGLLLIPADAFTKNDQQGES